MWGCVMLFKRKVKINIDIAGKQKVYEHSAEDKTLKIDFNIQKSMGQAESAQISIVGLPLNDIQELTTKFDYDEKGEASAKKNAVTIEAGYEEDYGIIFVGAVMEAKPNIASADFGVDMKLQGGYYAITKRESISLKNATLQDIAKVIADAYSYKLDFQAENKDIGDYSWNGAYSNQAQFRHFQKNYGVKAWLENGVLFVSDKDKPKKQTRALEIDCESGLIGQPEPLGKGINFTTLLRPSLHIGNNINMKFTKFPMLNGQYGIISINHKGSNYGGEFYSACQGQKL